MSGFEEWWTKRTIELHELRIHVTPTLRALSEQAYLAATERAARISSKHLCATASCACQHEIALEIMEG